MSEKTTGYKAMVKKWKLSEERNEIVDRVSSLLTAIEMEKYIPFLDDAGFFEAPASTKFHNSEIGGLARHCLSVYKIFKNMVQINYLDVKEETIIKCALFHDFCKLNYYKPKIFKTGKRKGELGWETDDQYPIGHGEKSVILLQMAGIPLNPKETLIIRWHMLNYDYEYKHYEVKVKKLCPEAIVFGLCDNLSSIIEDMDEVEEEEENE